MNGGFGEKITPEEARDTSLGTLGNILFLIIIGLGIFAIINPKPDSNDNKHIDYEAHDNYYENDDYPSVYETDGWW